MSETTSLDALHKNCKDLDVANWYQILLGNYTGTYDSAKLNPYEAEAVIPRSDRYTAEAIAEKFRNRVSYVTGAKEWHIWDGRVHQRCEGDDIAKHIVDIYSDQLKKALDEVKYCFTAEADAAVVSGPELDSVEKSKIKAEAKKKYEALFKEHRRYRNMLDATSGTRSVVEQLKTYLAVASDYFENDRDWFVVQNGVVDVVASKTSKNLVMVPHDPSRPVYRYFRANYDPNAEWPSLQRFLDNSLADESQADFFQRALGYVMIGAPVKTKTIVDAYGETNAGKSMINGVIAKLANDFYFEATEAAITKAGKDADMFRDQMRMARVISFLEVKSKLDKPFILKYTGGDVIETTRKYRNSVTWRAQGLIMLMSNEGMNIGSQEAAVASRIERIHFPHEFTDDHEDPRYRSVEGLDQMIIDEADGFLNWLLLGFIAQINSGSKDGKIKASESMGLLKNEMQDNNNTASIFWERFNGNRYEADLSAPVYKWVPFISVMADYKKWCKMTEHAFMEDSDVKAWFKRQGLVDRQGGKLRLKEMVEKENSQITF